MKVRNSLLVGALLILFGACKKSSNGNSNSWDVQYEISGTNALSKIALTYTDNTGTERSVGDMADTTSFVSMPWTYHAGFSKDASAMAARNLILSVVGATSFNTSAGDKITVKIFVDGSVVAQSDTPAFSSITVTYELH